MAQFAGFANSARSTPIPNLFFTDVLPQVQDVAELKVALHVFWALFQKKGSPRFVTFRELAGDGQLMSGLKGPGEDGAAALERSLRAAVARGILITIDLRSNGKAHSLYLLNTPQDQRDLQRILTGEIDLGAIPAPQPFTQEPRPNIFALYESNIGELTPMVADMLKEAEKAYPEPWIVDAMQEAVRNRVPKWSYIEATLRKWKSEGRDGGKDRRHTEKGEDSEKYFRGRYGHLVRRKLQH